MVSPLILITFGYMLPWIHTVIYILQISYPYIQCELLEILLLFYKDYELPVTSIIEKIKLFQVIEFILLKLFSLYVSTLIENRFWLST